MKHTVRIDGGLGSQMLCWMFFILRKEHEPKTRVDVSYFDSAERLRNSSSQPSIRNWELHHYGIDLSQVRSESVRSRKLILGYEKSFKYNRPYFSDLVNRNWSSTFPLCGQSQITLGNILGLGTDPFCAVHIRRGDFLQFSSKIVDLASVLEFCKSIHSFIPRSMIFVSDDKFSESEQTTIRSQLKDHDIFFLDDIDQHICHGIMRMADVLVTSNSTFSWTASLMSEKPDQTTFSPMTFSLPAHNISNEVFRSASNWSIRI